MEVVFPKELIQLGKKHLGIVWSDGHRSSYPVRKLRLECKCASCVDEWTREKRIDESKIDLEIHPSRIDPVGRYALQIHWSDGHNTGYYTFPHLREICECETCHRSS